MYNNDNCPFNIKKQINDITEYLKSTLSSCLVGVYLHGSLVLSCFDEKTSDIDMLAVINKRLSVEERLELAAFFVKTYKPPVEISIIAFEHLNPWRHPTPCQFHFSEYWKEQYESFIKEKNYSHWILTEDFTDGDIACHAKLTKQSGICLYGRPVDKVFPEVPEVDFWDSISFDVKALDVSDAKNYNILTLCRVWSYKELRRIISKYDAGIWAQKMLPDKLKYIVTNAVNEKYINYGKQKYDIEDLIEFKSFIIEKIFS